jgi:cytochrome c biogenesis protein CcdA
MNRTGGTFNFWKMLNFEKRLHLRKKRQGVLGAALLGMAFGAGWAP